MHKPLEIKHSYNVGDLITILAGLHSLYKERGIKTIIYQELNLPAFYYDGAVHPTKNEGQQVCMNQEMWDKVYPLLKAQEYIEDALIWEGQKVDIDFSESRDRKKIPMPYGDIYQWAFMLNPQLACDLSEVWLQAMEVINYPDLNNKILINRTQRYRNEAISYHFLKEYESDILFVGTGEEYADFCSTYKLSVMKLRYDNFLQLAQMIKDCKFFIGNQSSSWHIANALKKPRILEACTFFPHCVPYGKDGYMFLYQDAFEYFFNKLNFK